MLEPCQGLCPRGGPAQMDALGEDGCWIREEERGEQLEEEQKVELSFSMAFLSSSTSNKTPINTTFFFFFKESVNKASVGGKSRALFCFW